MAVPNLINVLFLTQKSHGQNHLNDIISPVEKIEILTTSSTPKSRSSKIELQIINLNVILCSNNICGTLFKYISQAVAHRAPYIFSASLPHHEYK